MDAKCMNLHKITLDQAYRSLLCLKDNKGLLKNPVIELQCKYKLAYRDALRIISQLEKNELISRPLIDSPNTRLLLDPCRENNTSIEVLFSPWKDSAHPTQIKVDQSQPT